MGEEKAGAQKAGLPLCLSSGSGRRTRLVAKIRGRWNGRGALSEVLNQAPRVSAAACADDDTEKHCQSPEFVREPPFEN